MKKTLPEIVLDLWIFLGLFFLVFILKASILDTPFHLDEIDFYSSVSKILKNNFNPFFERWGYHPPLVYELAALYEHFFGFSRIALHFLIVVFAFLALWFTYQLGKHFYGREVGFSSALLLLSCPLFFAQSGLFHLDIPLAALSMASLYFYFSRQKIGYLVAASLMLLTKETGVFIIAGLVAYECLKNLGKKKGLALVTRKLFIILMPGLCFCLWAWMNKIFLGWYVWPKYKDFLFFSKNIPWPTGSFWEKFRIAFLADWRWLITLSLVAGNLFLMVKNRFRQKIFDVQEVIFFILPLGTFVFFSLGMFLPRYMLFVYPLWLIYFSALVKRLIGKKAIYFVVVLLVVVLFVNEWYPRSGERVEWGGEMSMVYLDVVEAHKQAISFVEARHSQSRILCVDLMCAKMVEPKYGYVEKRINVVSYPDETNLEDFEIVMIPEYLRFMPKYQELFGLIKQKGVEPLKVFVAGGERVVLYQP